MRLQLWRVAYGGREYTGEVIKIDSWHPKLAQLPPQLPFRIVQLQRFQEVPQEAITDPRLCLLLPSRRSIRERGPAYAKEEIGPSQQILATPPLSPAQVFTLVDEPKRFDLIATGLLFYGELVSRSRPQVFRELAPIIPEIIRTRLYLEAIELAPGELALDRVAILEQLTSVNLIENPQLWGSIKALYSWFQDRYRSLYLNFHRQYFKELTSLKAKVKAAQPQLRALGMLNGIPELGEPMEVGLEAGYRELTRRMAPCHLAEAAVDEAPLCAGCGLRLSQETPSQEVEGLLTRLEAALKEQHRRLASQAIQLILSQRGEERVEQFIKVLQSSDPSPLVQILDDKLIAFLRQLLQDAQVRRVPFSLQPWLELFPFLEEGDIQAALQALEQQLQEALEQAKEGNRDKRIRLVFTLENEAHRRSRQPRPKSRPEPA